MQFPLAALVAALLATAAVGPASAASPRSWFGVGGTAPAPPPGLAVLQRGDEGRVGVHPGRAVRSPGPEATRRLDGVPTSLLVAGDVVYAASGAPGPALTAYAAREGLRPYFSVELPPEVAEPRLELADGSLFVLGGPRLLVLDPTSGALRRQVALPSAEPTALTTAVCLLPFHLAFFTTTDAASHGRYALACVDLITGEQRFRFDLGATPPSLPAFTDESVVVGWQGPRPPGGDSPRLELLAVDFQESKEIWRHDAGYLCRPGARIMAAEDVLYAQEGDDPAPWSRTLPGLTTLRARTGSILVGHGVRGGTRRAAALAPGFLVVASGEGMLHAFPTRKGPRGWTHSLDASPSADLAASGDAVYAGSANGLQALDTTSGRLLWSLPGAPVALLAPGDGVLAWATTDGRLHLVQ